MANKRITMQFIDSPHNHNPETCTHPQLRSEAPVAKRVRSSAPCSSCVQPEIPDDGANNSMPLPGRLGRANVRPEYALHVT
jgi:hypothetical protein